MTRAIRGHLIEFISAIEVRSWPDGAIIIDADRIGAIGDASVVLKGFAGEIEDYRGCLIMPGLIDTHIHLPQTQVIASYGTQLLEWLQKYTFVEEQRFADSGHCAANAAFYCDELIRNGTTTAVTYGSVHKQSIDALFEAASARNMRMLGGKVMMDRNAPAALQDTAQSGYDDSKNLIERWHGKGRNAYVVTPRFAITSTDAQLEAAGTLLREHPDCYLQTHLAENHDEIRTVAELFPWSKNYTDVYDHFGLLGPNSLFGHCIHLSDAECQRLSETGSIACFCPTSNLFIGSGLFDLKRITDACRPIAVTLATDIGGGTSYSMLRTAHEAYKILQLQGQNWPARAAFHMMTRGNAEALGLAHEIGTLEPGSIADLTILDPNATEAMAHRAARLDDDLDALLFMLMMMGDDRTIAATLVAGQKLHDRRT